MGTDYHGMFGVPDYIERNRKRKENLIRAVLCALLVISVFSGISVWWNTADIIYALIFGGSTFICALGLWLLERGRGRQKRISLQLLILLWLFFTIISYLRGEVTASLSVGYMVLMIIAMVMIGRWAGWLVIVSSLLVYILIPMIVNISGPSSLVLPDSTSHQFYTQIALMILGAVLLDISIQGMNQSLRISRIFEQRYRALFERSNNAIFIINLDMELIETNQAGEVLLGYSQDELRNLKAEKIVANPESPDSCISRTISGEVVPISEDQLITKKGELVDVEINTSLVSDENDQPLYYQCIVRDIRERKKAKNKLIEYTQRYQSMFDGTVDAVLIVGLDGEQLDTNEQAAKMLGYISVEELQGKSRAELYSPGDEMKFQQVLAELLAGEKVPEFDWEMFCKDGRKIIVETSAGLVFDSDGTPLYVQMISRDVTAKRMREERLENSLAQMEKLAMTDPLTKLLNRRGILEQAKFHLGQAKLRQSAFSLILIDVDLLKNINDGYGHHAGDITLIYIAAQLELGMRVTDRVGRWGGDEFLIIMPGTGLREAEIIARRLNELIGQKEVEEERRAFRVGTSIGVAGTESDGGGVYDLNTILEMADKAMYMAKETGRHEVVVFRQSTEVGN